MEQLEAQTREMNQIISELETRKTSTDNELKVSEEKVCLLRDIIANLEHQLEQKTTHENEILEQLEEMKNTIEERDSKMRTLLGELESLKSERVEHSDVVCVKCGQDEVKATELMERVKEQVGIDSFCIVLYVCMFYITSVNILALYIFLIFCTAQNILINLYNCEILVIQNNKSICIITCK